MNDEYNTILKAQDANAFAKSRFGQHYLVRLAEVRDDHYRKARTMQREGAEPWLVATEVARADEIDGEIAYFTQAREIAESPKLMQRIRDNLKRKKKADD